MNKVDLCFTSANDLAKMLRDKQISPVELTQTFLERIEQINPQINAYCTLTPETAMEQARAAEALFVRGEIPAHAKLLGLPVSIKDLIITKGVRTTRGSLLFKDFVPEEDAPSVERVKAAGAVVLGKTNTPEFGWTGSTNNRVFGRTRNPWDLSKTPGGSSGGAGAEVAAGLGPLAIGSDGGGSIRIPASYSGIFGIKPSLGRVPIYPAQLGNLSHVGPLTRTVADAALLLEVIAGPDERDRYSLPAEKPDYREVCEAGARDGLKGLRIAWSANLGYIPVEPEVAALTEKAAKRFAELGATVEAVDPGFASPADTLDTLFYGAMLVSLAPILPTAGNLLDPGLLYQIERSQEKFNSLTYANALVQRDALWDVVRRFFSKYDLLLTPTMPQTAFDVNIDFPTEIAGHSTAETSWTPFTFPFNLTGQPAASVPCGFTQANLPVGLQIVGRRWDDKGVLKAAAAFEALQPWAERRPTL